MQGGQHDTEGKTLDLEVHLTGSDAFRRTRDFEIHVAEVVFVAQDVAEYRVAAFLVHDQTHRDAETGLVIRMPASISAQVPAQTVAMEEEPFDSRISDTIRTV